jgi:2,4-didehydro-3-deoxy-L-rhamnonate hydrolase
MKFVAYYPEGRTARRKIAMGVVVGEKVTHLTDIDSFYDDLPHWRQLASGVKEGRIELADLERAPPIPVGAKIICAAINYRKHGEEANIRLPEFPNLFARWTSELVVDGDTVPVPLSEPDGLDWEVELAAIVGAPLTDVDAATAEAALFGFTVANDISARYSQVQAMTLPNGQWALGKNPERSCPVGSFVEDADGFDYRNRTLQTLLNGEVMQSGNTDEMIFTVGDLAAFASRHITLRPGDMILTGTPDGVGYARVPRRMMLPGDTISVSVAGLGTITNTIVDSGSRG